MSTILKILDALLFLQPSEQYNPLAWLDSLPSFPDTVKNYDLLDEQVDIPLH